MANINPGIYTPYSFPQCVQTSADARVVYTFTQFGNANRNSGGSLNIKELNTTITPRLSTSKIMISVSLSYDQIYAGAWYLIRRVGGVATEIGSAPPSGDNRPYGFACAMWHNPGNNIIPYNACRSFLDTPNTTSPVTYELWVYNGNSSDTFFVLNGCFTDTNLAHNWRGTSQMILQEFFV